MLEQGNVLTLSDNKEYSIVFSTKYNNSNYIYIIDQDDYNNTMFCKFNDVDDELEEVTDKKIIENLLLLFLESQNK